MGKPSFPVDVVVGGRVRHVVGQTAMYWVERTPDGRHVGHVGQLLLEGQRQFHERPDPKPCTRCRQSTTQCTPRKRARHDACENTQDLLPDDIALAIEFGAAADLGATIISVKESPW